MSCSSRASVDLDVKVLTCLTRVAESVKVHGEAIVGVYLRFAPILYSCRDVTAGSWMFCPRSRVMMKTLPGKHVPIGMMFPPQSTFSFQQFSRDRNQDLRDDEIDKLRGPYSDIAMLLNAMKIEAVTPLNLKLIERKMLAKKSFEGRKLE